MIHKAIEFAAKAHVNQTRKGTNIPYIVHPFEVAQILTSNNCDDKLIVAGLLHDTVEDTVVTIEEIENEFGVEIANLVAACSEDKTKSWEDRKKHTVDYLSNEASMDVLLLSCADKLSNLRSNKADYEKVGEKLWDRFNRPKKSQNWYYSSLINAFEPLNEYEMYSEISNLYTDLFDKD